MNRKLTLSLLSILIVGFIYFKYLKKPSIEVFKASYGKAVESVYATGYVESVNMYPVSSQISAKLLELFVDEGDRVRKDQMLARLDGKEFKELEIQLKAKEDLSYDQFLKAEKLYKQGAISEEEYKTSKAEWVAAKALTSSARSKADYAILKASTDGQVIKRDGEVGQLITPSQAVFWISPDGDLRVSAEVDEEEILKVKVGQKVLMQSDALGDRVVEGSVLSITPKGDNLSRSYRVRISVPKDSPLLIGMTVESNIVTRINESALLIPTTALVNSFVFKVDDNGLVAKVKVEVGAKGPDRSEIKSGLSEGDFVIVAPKKDQEQDVRVEPIVTATSETKK